MSTSRLAEFKRALRAQANAEYAARAARYFKTGPGEYGEGDRFLGLRVPQQRALAKQFKDLTLNELAELLHSPWHEERLSAGLILVKQYERSRKKDLTHAQAILECLIENRQGINNWDIVDSVIPKTLGVASLNDPKILQQLHNWLHSDSLWERRMAMLSTLAWIQNGDDKLCHEFARSLLQDKEDLIHKAVGWMLREAGKKQTEHLLQFLEQHAAHMPRTMLRYAIEKLSTEQRKDYLSRRDLKV